MKCPKCQSDKWKMAKVLYNEGITNIKTNSSGRILGGTVGTSGINVGYAGNEFETTGKYQTEFSKLISPPEVPSKPIHLKYSVTDFAPIFGVSIVLYWIFTISKLLGFFSALLAVLFLGKIIDYLKRKRIDNLAEYEEDYKNKMIIYNNAVVAYTKWEKAAICSRCGELFYPEFSN